MKEQKQMYVLNKAVHWKKLDEWVTNNETVCVAEDLSVLLNYCKVKWDLIEVEIEDLEKCHLLEDVFNEDGSACDLLIECVEVLK